MLLGLKGSPFFPIHLDQVEQKIHYIFGYGLWEAVRKMPLAEKVMVDSTRATHPALHERDTISIPSLDRKI